MERIYDWLLAVGYPEDGVDWLRRRRLPIIMVLMLLSWAVFIGLCWLLIALFF